MSSYFLSGIISTHPIAFHLGLSHFMGQTNAFRLPG
jgi:hypothetical protein